MAEATGEPGAERVWPALSAAERDVFLSESRVAVLSVERPNGAPLSLPIWYAYFGGRFWLDTIPESLHGRLMRAAGRATICVQKEEEPQRYVTAAGPVCFLTDAELRADGWTERGVADRIASRYLSGEDLERWIDAARPAFTLQIAVLTAETVWAAAVSPVAEILSEVESGS